MTERRVEAAKVGLFVAVSGVVLAAFLFTILAPSWLRREKRYYAVFPFSVAGLDEGSSVRYLGVPAGRVERIAFEEEEFPSIRVAMRVRPDVPVKVGTRARLRFNPLTGLGGVELEGGSPGEADLDPGERIGEMPSLIDQVTASLPGVLDRVAATLEEISRAAHAVEATLDPAMRGKIRDAIEAVGAAAGEIRSATSSIREDVRAARSAFDAVASTAADVERTSASFREDVRAARAEVAAAREGFVRLTEGLERESGGWGESIRGAAGDVSKAARDVSGLVAGEDAVRAVSRLRSFSEDLARLSERFDRTLEVLRTAVETGRPMLSETLLAVRQTVRNLKDFVDRIRDDPSALLLGGKREERPIPDGGGR